MDGRPHPSPNAQHIEGGFATGRVEGDTLTVADDASQDRLDSEGRRHPRQRSHDDHHAHDAHDDLLTVTTIQEDPYYLTEPHVVSRMFQWQPTAGDARRATCNTANIIPRLEDTQGVPHYPPGQNPEADYMLRTFNLPMEAAMGYAETLYPEYRKTLKGAYAPRRPAGSAPRLLLRVDRAARPARWSSQSHVRRRRLRRTRSSRTPAGGRDVGAGQVRR